MIAVSSFAPISFDETAYGYIETNPNKKQTLASVENLSHTERAVRNYFEDIPVMIQVARCESQYRHTLSDGSVLTGRVNSSDIGVMQINLKYHSSRANTLGLNLYDLYDNMEYARDLYERKGTQPWSASAPCWSKTLAQR